MQVHIIYKSVLYIAKYGKAIFIQRNKNGYQERKQKSNQDNSKETLESFEHKAEEETEIVKKLERNKQNF